MELFKRVIVLKELEGKWENNIQSALISNEICDALNQRNIVWNNSFPLRKMGQSIGWIVSRLCFLSRYGNNYIRGMCAIIREK